MNTRMSSRCVFQYPNMHIDFIDLDILQIGGGILAGLAAVGGAAFAYHKHEEHKEEV